MSKTKNLGQVSGVFIGMSAPKNTSIIWYDDTPSQRCHKVYDPVTNSWVALSPDIVSNTTYSELIFNAQKNGLSIGKHYVITDKSNVLAIAITATKVQYPDSLGNILIDDLGTNIQYHVSSSNLLIDDLSGVFNVESNKLVFQFQEQINVNIETDYLFGKVRSGKKWILSKFHFSSLISKDVNNSISWSSGLFFSFKNAINKILNKSGGVVGYDDYSTNISQINKNIENVSKNNQEILNNVNKSITDKTKDSAIYDKKIQNNIDVTISPGDVIIGDSLFSIISKFQRWINKFKYATGIRLSKGFSDAKSQQYINNNDTVETAFAKIQYILKNPTKTSFLPEDWSIGALMYDGSFSNEYTAFNEDGVPVAGDSIFYAFAKITDFIQHIGDFATLSSDWREISYSSGVEIKFPVAGDSIDMAFKKIVAKIRMIGNISYGIIESHNQKTIFDLNSGYLLFKDDNYNELKLSNGSIKMSNSTNDILNVSEKGLIVKSQNCDNNKNEIYSSSLIESSAEVDFKKQQCAFQSSIKGDFPNQYDAFFSRLKLNSLFFSKITLVNYNANYNTFYLERNNSVILYDHMVNFDPLIIYLPNISGDACKIVYIIAQNDETEITLQVDKESDDYGGINYNGGIYKDIVNIELPKSGNAVMLMQIPDIYLGSYPSWIVYKMF